MVYCAQCGTQNEDDASFCKKCGASLTGEKPRWERRQRDDRCEEECQGGHNGKGWGYFWGVIIILIGLAILFEVVIKDMAQTYTWLSWVNSIQWNWIFAIVISIVIILFGIRIISKR
ncbi:MAG: zinc ribbon domain-containing protein [Candidatus Thermoplasmatota archaeon]|nr:zinc ribbon domain-containing protein [Candidatus Thermoplasmatota archaeon]